MKDFIQQSELYRGPRLRQRKAYASQWTRQAHLKLPSIRDLVRRMEWAASTDLTAISTANRCWAESTFNSESLQATWAKALLPLPTSRR